MEQIEKHGQQSLKAAQIVLIELIEILEDFKDFIVLVGGNVPPHMLPHTEKEYYGTVDIDIAIDPRVLTEATSARLNDILAQNGFYQRESERPFRYFRDIDVDGDPVSVMVDILSAEYGGEDVGAEYCDIHGVKALRAKGSNLAFERSKLISISGKDADGKEKTITVRIPMLVPFIVMKVMALHDRDKPKDAYDIYFCLSNYHGGINAVIDEFCELLNIGRVNEALEKLAEYFKSPEDSGPRNAAELTGYETTEDRDLIRRNAYELVRELVLRLKVMEEWEYGLD